MQRTLLSFVALLYPFTSVVELLKLFCADLFSWILCLWQNREENLPFICTASFSQDRAYVLIASVNNCCLPD